MDGLEELASVVSDRVAKGEIWDVEFVTWVVDQPAMKVELEAAGKRLCSSEPSISFADWTNELSGRFRLAIAKSVVSEIRELARYWRKSILHCVINALREYRRGTGPRSGGTKIKPSSSDLFEPHVTDSGVLASYFGMRTKPDFEIRELEHCIYEQIKRNFAKKIQTILILRVIHSLSQSEIARALGVTASAVSQNIGRHQILLSQLIHENCLEEMT